MHSIKVAAALCAAALFSTSAIAAVVPGTLTAQYFRVASGSDPDFNIYSTPNVMNGSALGPNGLPVAVTPFGVNDLIPLTNEINWWSPAFNSNVELTGTGTIALPFASNMFPSNAMGFDNNTHFLTAIFTGTFSLAASSTITFKLGSDDDSFIYVDGILFGQNPGVHAVTNVEFTSPTLAAGSHDITVFFADRQQTGAYLSLELISEDIEITPTPLPGVPEPGSWAMLIAGLGGIGALLRRRRPMVAIATA